MTAMTCPHCAAQLEVNHDLVPATIRGVSVTLVAPPPAIPAPAPVPPPAPAPVPVPVPTPSPAPAPSIRLFHHGINIAWRKYGNDFGNRTEGVKAHSAWWDTHLGMLAGHGVTVARTWMFPRLQDTWTAPQIGAAVDTIKTDLGELLRLGTKHNIRFELTMLDGAQNTSIDVTTLKDATLRRRFIDEMFLPVFSAFASHPQILAIDALNEPEWGFDLTSDRPALEDYFHRLAAACRTLNLWFTVGWGTHEHGRKFNTLKRPDGSPLVDYYEFHNYLSHETQFPSAKLLAKKAQDWNYGRPIVIGEIDHEKQPGILERAWGLGYAGVWAWSSADVDSHRVTWAEYDAFVRAHPHGSAWRSR